MQFHRDISEGVNIIRAVASGGVYVDDRLFESPCVIGISTIIENWAVTTVGEITDDQLKPVIELEPALIILGSGATLQFPPGTVGKMVNKLGIGFEVMDTAAGCRTYNLLAHEGRNVALALIK